MIKHQALRRTLAAILMAPAFVAGVEAAATEYAWPVVKVIDGDTVNLDASVGSGSGL